MSCIDVDGIIGTDDVKGKFTEGCEGNDAADVDGVGILGILGVSMGTVIGTGTDIGIVGAKESITGTGSTIMGAEEMITGGTGVSSDDECIEVVEGY